MKKNIVIYSLSFVCSVLLWLYVNLNLNYTIVFPISLDVKLSNSQALVNDLPSYIDVTMKGKGWELLGILLTKKTTYYLDLTNNKKDIKINISQKIDEFLGLTGGVSILSINPDVIDINFDNIVSRMIKIKNLVNVIPKDGYMIIGNPKISPDSVRVSGAMSIIGKIKFIPTEQININNINSGITRTVKILDTLKNIIKIEPKTVSMTYYIELSAEKIFEDISVIINNVPPDKEVLLIPPKLKLYLKGGVEQLAKINPDEIFANVEYKQIENDSLGYITPKITLPVDATVVNYEPRKFQYIIKKKT
jgi:YbbR domain-containing protein